MNVFASGPLAIAAVLACCAATLIAYNQPPSATLLNQVAALMAWGGLAAVLLAGRGVSLARAWLPLAAMGLLGLAVPVSALESQLPWSLAWHAMALLVGAMLLLLAGVSAAGAGRRAEVLSVLSLGWVVAGLLSVVVCVVQVFFPGWADGDWIARSGLPGRAISNMRQPNHLASLLMWSCVAAVWLFEARVIRRWMLLALLGSFIFTVVLSASRTGMVGVAILALWGLLDRRKLTRDTRWALLATPVMLALSWVLMSAWAQAGEHAFGAANRLAEGAGSPSRIAILSNAWALVKANPWTGVGFGEFNLAWSMTPFPGRPTAFFDHTHDLPMQLMVELGLPMSLLVLGLLGWSFVRAFMAGQRTSGQAGTALRCAFMMVLMIGVHSLVEYPLWYAYFLLPTALFLGLCLGEVEPTVAASALSGRVLTAGALLMVVAGLATLVEYRKVVVIYAPPAGAGPLEERIERGQRSWLFSTQADYAAATTFPPGEAALAAAKRTAHNLIDVRLMMAWAQSLHATGDDERARYVVERLKEFRSPQAAEWLAVCDAPLAAGEKKPFQCEPVTREFDFREMK